MTTADQPQTPANAYGMDHPQTSATVYVVVETGDTAGAIYGVYEDQDIAHYWAEQIDGTVTRTTYTPLVPRAEAAAAAQTSTPAGEDTGDVDPWAHVRQGDTIVDWLNDEVGCYAESSSGLHCTRTAHPRAWQHIATDLSGEVLETWRETVAADLAAGAPGIVRAVVLEQCPVCEGRFPVDANGDFLNHAMPHPEPGVCRTDHEPMWLADTAPDQLRRRAAVLAWMANHQELPTPYEERHGGKCASTLHYGYPGPDGLTALYRALDLDDDAVSLNPETGGYVRIEAWIGGWKVLIVIDFDEHTDDFCSHLSASENPGRFLGIVSALHTHPSNDS